MNLRHECAPRTIVHEEHHWGFQPTEQVSMLIHHNRWTSVGYTCWYPLMKMVDMPVLNHVRLQLHLIGHESSLLHDCTSPPLRLIPGITNHYRVTHCKLVKSRMCIMPGLFSYHLPFRLMAQKVEAIAD